MDRRATTAAALLLGVAWSAYLVYPALLPQLQEVKGVPTAQLGWFGTAGFLATFAGQVLVAPRADRVKQRPVMLAAGFVIALGLGGFALVRPLPLLILARAVAGLGLGVLGPCVTAAAMRHAPNPGRTAGVLQAATSAGIAIGPLAGSLAVAHIGADTILLIGALAIVAILPVIRSLPEHEPQPGPAPRGNGLRLLRSRRFWGAGLIGAAFMAAVGAYDTLWSRFLTDIGGSETIIGLSFVLFAIPYALLAGFAGRFVDRHGPIRSAALGGTAMVTSICCYGLVHHAGVVTVIALLESSGQAFVAVAGTVAVTRAAPPDQQATAHGTAAGIGTVVAAATAAAAAPVYAHGGAALLFLPTAALYVLIMATGLRLTRAEVSPPVLVGT